MSACFCLVFSLTFSNILTSKAISPLIDLIVLRRLTLQLILDHVYSAADEGKPTLLISLDLSAAFDTVDHSVLLKRLSCSFGVAGNVLSWIQSYLYV